MFWYTLKSSPFSGVMVRGGDQFAYVNACVCDQTIKAGDLQVVGITSVRLLKLAYITQLTIRPTHEWMQGLGKFDMSSHAKAYISGEK
jgi:hypothetical protein